MKQEKWVDIKDCVKYEVSNNGNIRHKNDKTAVEEWLFRGYRMVNLIGDNGYKKQLSIHRVVALTFIENPLNKAQVNHKNAIRTDNRVENLEWVTASENLMHARNLLTRKTLYPKKGSNSPIAVKVIQYTMTGNFIAEYGSMVDAEKATGIRASYISRCCSGRAKSSGGFIWKRKGL